MHRKNLLQGALLPYRNCITGITELVSVISNLGPYAICGTKSDVEILDLIDVICRRDRPQHEPLGQGEEAQEDEVVRGLPSHSYMKIFQ